MVSSEEISKRLRNKREGKSLNGYLVCNNCGGYYELQPGESWKKFDLECECGGQLAQSATDSLFSRKKGKRTKLHPLLKIVVIIGGGILISNIFIVPVMFLLIYGGAALGPYGHYFFAVFFGILIAIILGLLWFIFRRK